MVYWTTIVIAVNTKTCKAIYANIIVVHFKCILTIYFYRVKTRLHELLQQDREFTREDREQINPGNALSINAAMDFVKNPVRCCQHVHTLIQKLMDIVRIKKDDPKTKGMISYITIL